MCNKFNVSPYRLSEGIWLEDASILLSWDARLDELREIASPEVHVTSDRTTLLWRNRQWLNGLECTINAIFWPKPALSGNYYGLQFVNYHIHLPNISGEARVEHACLKNLLRQRLGDPTRDCMHYSALGLPVSEWDMGEILIVLMVSERFGEYVVGEVWHKPPAWRLNSKDETQ